MSAAPRRTEQRELEKILRAIKGIMAAIEDGLYQPSMKARMIELEQQEAEIEARLSEGTAGTAGRGPECRRGLPGQGAAPRRGLGRSAG